VNEDFRDLLGALLAAEARFLVVGAHAMAVHSVPRATGDLGVWIAADAANAARVWSALLRFGAPVAAMGVSQDDLTRPDQVLQIGLPPRRIDILTSISGVGFDEAWTGRVTHEVGGLPVPFLGRAELVRNKRATGRTKDRADLEALGEAAE
jgi:glycine cleavage system aminomethyltransferase T